MQLHMPLTPERVPHARTPMVPGSVAFRSDLWSSTLCPTITTCPEVGHTTYQRLLSIVD